MNAMFIQSTAYDYLLKPLVRPTDDKLFLQASLRDIVMTMRSKKLVTKRMVNGFFIALNSNGGMFSIHRQEDAM